MSPALEPSTEENTNVFTHHIAGDSLIYKCPNCEFGEMLVTGLIESDDARCPDCGTRYRSNIETMA